MKTYILKEVLNENSAHATTRNKFVTHSPDDFLRGIKNKTGGGSYYVETWENGGMHVFESLDTFKKEFVKQFGIHI